jgi:DNA-binding MarR family transcriptional regulator
MTAAGRKAYETGTRIRQKAEQALLGELSLAERRQLTSLMAKLEKSAR